MRLKDNTHINQITVTQVSTSTTIILLGFKSYIIHLSCIKDSTFDFIDTDSNSQPLSDPKVKRFTFKSFSFLDSNTPIYIHAVVKVCSVSNSR